MRSVNIYVWEQKKIVSDRSARRCWSRVGVLLSAIAFGVYIKRMYWLTDDAQFKVAVGFVNALVCDF